MQLAQTICRRVAERKRFLSFTHTGASRVGLKFSAEGNVRFGSWLCKNAETRDGDRMNILRNRIPVRKDSQSLGVARTRNYPMCENAKN
jgi:hypothetical protein